MISGSFVRFVFLAFGAVWLFPFLFLSFPFLFFFFPFPLGALLFPLSFATPPFHKLCSKSFFFFLFFCFCFFFAFKECNDPLIDSSNQSTSKHNQQHKEEQTTTTTTTESIEANTEQTENRERSNTKTSGARGSVAGERERERDDRPPMLVKERPAVSHGRRCNAPNTMTQSVRLIPKQTADDSG